MVQSGRRFKRVARQISAQFSCEGRYARGRIKNLSKQGMFIRAAKLPRSGQPVRIRFETSSEHKIEVVGRVRWTTAELQREDITPGFGVLLESPGVDYREFFKTLLRE